MAVERDVTHVLVMAKAPQPGEVKTRLMPALSASQAAEIARAALEDTLAAVRRCAASRHIVALAGDRGPWLGDGFEVLAQRGTTFTERLTDAWAYAGAPGIQIGMDTPQITAELLDDALARLAHGRDDALVGPACDGGWWALGLRAPIGGVFDGVPMSRVDTGERQVARLRELGLRVGLLPELRDIDEPDDLAAVAAGFPHLRVAAAARRFDAEMVP